MTSTGHVMGGFDMMSAGHVTGVGGGHDIMSAGHVMGGT